MFVKSKIIAGDKELIVYANEPKSLLEIIAQSGISVDAPCAGLGRCGKCRVNVQGNLPQDNLETSVLSGEEIKAGVRLACRKRSIPGNLIITIPSVAEEQVKAAYKIEPADTGIAVDLGTTSIITAFVNISDGTIMAMHNMLNPQRIYGADVVSRIHAGLDRPTLEKMMHMTVNTIAEGIGTLLSEIGLEADRIRSIQIAGNTTMEHIIAGMDVSGLARAPYTPAFIHSMRIPELKKSFGVATDNISLFPVIGGFVGGDTVASILACGMDMSDDTVALIDIGTNAEVAIGNKDRIFVSSAPAGPAFEGGQIKQGMRAQDGAIEGMHIAGDDIRLDIKGDKEPRGICGSGLIRIVSELVKAGIVTDSGELLDASRIASNLALRSLTVNREQAFTLYRSYMNDVHIYQSDIRALQLAKASIAAGLSTLINNAGIKPSYLYIAGAFGNYLNPEDLGLIGMIPSELVNHTYFIGDSVISGLRRFIINDPPVAMDKLLSGIKHVELANDPAFNDRFVSMLALKPYGSH